MTIRAANIHASLGMHVANVRVTMNAAPALQFRIFDRLLQQIDVQ